MKNRLMLLALLIAVPLIALYVGHQVRTRMDSGWHAAVTQQFGAAVAADPRNALEAICAAPDTARKVSDVCPDYQRLTWMKSIAIGTGAVGLGLMLLIALAGQVAKSNRVLLLSLFKPLLYVTVFGVLGLILVHGVLAMASIWYGESAMTGRVHVKAMGLVGVGAVLGVFSISRQLLATLRMITSKVKGKLVTRESNPTLWQYVDDLSRRLGTAPPRQIVAGLEPNFFVTEADVTCLDGDVKGRTLYLSLPVCRILNRGELAAIVGHELGHFRGADTQFSQRFYPIYRSAETALYAVAESTGHWLQNLALMPALYTLGYFLESFRVAESAVSRERELLADQAGVEAAGVEAMGSALVKVHAYSEVWEAVDKTMAEALRQGKQVINASVMYAGMVQENAAPTMLKGIAQKRIAHPMDSHPPLSLRLEALGVGLAQVSEAALTTAPDQPAIGLFAGTEGLEQDLTDFEHQLMVHTGRVAVGSATAS
jgi:Zn-dependent protease with chaperone function